MRFQTPQFIEVEDKIFGPFTLWQFIYLAGGAGLAFIAWRLIPIKIVSIVIIVPIVALTLALAFYKVNNRPFISLLESAFSFFTKSKLYVWKKSPPKKIERKEAKEEKDMEASLNVPRLSDSKLKELAWSLDIQDSPSAQANARAQHQQH